MFKYIGLFLGYYVLGFFGAFLGYMIGSSIDRAQAYGIGGINPLSSGQRQKVFLDTVFVLMGKLAKADGHISKDEIDHVEVFIKKIGMTVEHRQEAINQFKRGSEADFDMTDTLDQFMTSCGHTLNLKQVLLMYLTVMALADGNVDDSERTVLEKIGLHLGYSRSEFKRILDMVLNQAHFSQGQTDPKTALADAYKALGVPADNTDQQVKRAYRKLMSQHHPDKLIGQGVPEDMIKVATAQAQEIQLAYDLIKKHRNKS
ncbi:molecular chaperone DjlA [Methylophaga sp. 42_25_T18]|nr:molecular chaperone DjlA [Methylophaga sp. 42_25_T18]OUR85589.1 molecular chaperone DjlA [Methylophaga sp. 42_8_T64]